MKTERRKPRNDEALRVFQGSENDEREMEVPLRTGWIHPQQLPPQLSSLHPDHLVETADKEAVQVTVVWIILAVLLFLWILKTM